MKKISLLLTFALVMTLAVPAFAAEDNVKITGEVKTVFEKGTYGDDVDATTTLLADGDALDLDNPAKGEDGDEDDFPATKAFYQEIDFAITGAVNENVTFDLAIDTLVNNFTTVSGPSYNGVILGDQSSGNTDDSNIQMDTALLTLNSGVSTLKLGDMSDYAVDTYFVDEEDMEGMELTTNLSGNDVKVFMTSENDDFAGQDFYGVTVGRNLGALNLTGKLYATREASDNVTNFAVAGDYTVNDMVTVNGEVVLNDADQGFSGDSDSANNAEGDTAIFLGADFVVSNALTVNAGLESVGEEFVSVAGDLEEDYDYDLFTVGASYALNNANTLGATYTMVDHNKDENKSNIKLTLDNVRGAFTNTAAIELVANDGYESFDDDATIITLGTEYAMSEVITLNASLTNKSGDLNEFTYLTAGLDAKVAKNINWSTEAKLIDGTTKDDKDGEGSTLTTKLTVSF